jgi:hypothetical protein
MFCTNGERIDLTHDHVTPNSEEFWDYAVTLLGEDASVLPSTMCYPDMRDDIMCILESGETEEDMVRDSAWFLHRPVFSNIIVFLTDSGYEKFAQGAWPR